MDKFDLLALDLKTTQVDIRDLRKDMSILRKDIANLNAFKWQTIGIASFFSVLFSGIGVVILIKLIV